MPTALSPHPTLSPPVVLGSYGRPPPHSRAASSSLQTHAASSSRTSHVSLGECVRVSSGTVRRARGLVVTVAAGHSVSLCETASHVAVQSFPVAPNVQICTPPLTIIQSRGEGSTKTSLRVTYLGVVSPQKSSPPQTEVWAWTEVLNDKAVQPASQPQRSVAQCAGSMSSLHPLSSGQLLVRAVDGTLSVLSHAMDAEDGVSLNVIPLEQGPEAQIGTSSRAITHHLSVLDASASAQLFTGGRLPRDDVLATVVAFTSKAKPASSSTGPASASTLSADAAAATEKKKGRRKTAMEVIDDAEGDVNSGGALVGFGDLQVQVSLVLTSSDKNGKQQSPTLLRGQVSETLINDASRLLDLHLYHDGRTSLLTREGDLLLGHLAITSSSGGLAVSVSASSKIALANIQSGPSPSSKPAAVVRLSASHLLIVLAAQDGSAKGRMAALLWDAELEALLVASDWSIPSAAAGLGDSADRKTAISASRVGRSQVLVHAAFSGTAQGQSFSLDAIWALPFSVPETGSVLRHAIGKAALTEAWTRTASSSSSGDGQHPAASASSSSSSNLPPREAELVRKLRTVSEASGPSTEKRVAEMETLFTSWLSEETHRVRADWDKEKLQREKEQADEAANANANEAESDSDESEDGVKDETKDEESEAVAAAAAVAETEAVTSSKRSSNRKERVPKVPLSHMFVSSLLDVALPPSRQQKTRPYARKIISYVVDRHAVSCGMLAGSEQSLLSRLRAHNDWQQVMHVIRTVADISEAELVDVLRTILRAQRSDGAAAAAATTTGTETIPRLDTFLSLFVTMSISRPLLRSTLHSSISDCTDVCLMFDTITQWLKGRYYEPLDVNPFIDEKASAARRGRQRLATGGKGHDGQGIAIAGVSSAKAPPTKDLVQFAMDLMDIYFPLLLTTPSSHRSLRALSQALQGHLVLCDELTALRGPLDAYARLESDRKRISEEMSRRAVVDRYRDPRKARAGASAQGGNVVDARAETGGGLAAPDLNKSARLRAFEASALVGPHSVETLEI